MICGSQFKAVKHPLEEGSISRGRTRVKLRKPGATKRHGVSKIQLNVAHFTDCRQEIDDLLLFKCMSLSCHYVIAYLLSESQIKVNLISTGG